MIFEQSIGNVSDDVTLIINIPSFSLIFQSRNCFVLCCLIYKIYLNLSTLMFFIWWELRCIFIKTTASNPIQTTGNQFSNISEHLQNNCAHYANIHHRRLCTKAILNTTFGCCFIVATNKNFKWIFKRLYFAFLFH